MQYLVFVISYFIIAQKGMGVHTNQRLRVYFPRLGRKEMPEYT